ncbi:hypothetical protein GCM10011515_17090 [Tsuneonella deserti]|uniref:SH3 domain-containing protein n=2 Tax=Tsuneonella deserti TaxID=2035528 RepID=A0ABQ1SA12_9SPHN|nr:hypothetical protein GCM10011515_17090 [Tsuneonella deserti]
MIAGRTPGVLVAVVALALAACSQENAPSDKIRNAADTVVDQVGGSSPVRLALGKYAPRDDCQDLPGAEDFRGQLAAAIKRRDTDALTALAAPDVKLDFGGGSGRAQLRALLESQDSDLWAELDQLMRLGCGVNKQGGLSIPWYVEEPFDNVDPASAMLVVGERVPMRSDPLAEAGEAEEVSWDIVTLVSGLEPDKPFQKVRTSDGTEGFIATDKLRSLLDYRLIASSRDGKWSFTSLVAGD